MPLSQLSRNIANSLNPLIGGSSSDTMQNLICLLDGQCSLIADRTTGATLNGEMALYFLQVVGGAIRFESAKMEQSSAPPNGN